MFVGQNSRQNARRDPETPRAPLHRHGLQIQGVLPGAGHRAAGRRRRRLLHDREGRRRRLHPGEVGHAPGGDAQGGGLLRGEGAALVGHPPGHLRGGHGRRVPDVAPRRLPAASRKHGGHYCRTEGGEDGRGLRRGRKDQLLDGRPRQEECAGRGRLREGQPRQEQDGRPPLCHEGAEQGLFGPERAGVPYDWRVQATAGDQSHFRGEDLPGFTGQTVRLLFDEPPARWGAYGLAGLRVGWAYCPSEVINVLGRLRIPFSVNSTAQKVAVAAIDDQKHILKSIEHNNLWLPKITKELENNGFHTIPSSCNFVLFEVSEKLSFDANYVFDFLCSRGLILRQMHEYNLPNFLRLTIGNDEANNLLIESLRELPKKYEK